MQHVDLFSGVGGFSLASQWAGFDTIAHCECEAYCRAVLAYRFPGVPICEDVRGFNDWFVRQYGNRRVDLLTFGFPCQDISVAGKQEGLDGERSGLWFAALAVVEHLRPSYVVAENVSNLYSHGVDICLSGLEAAGYEAGAFVVGADDIGAGHRRKRVFLVGERKDLAYPNRKRKPQPKGTVADIGGRTEYSGEAMADTQSGGVRLRGTQRSARQFAPCGEAMANADSLRSGTEYKDGCGRDATACLASSAGDGGNGFITSRLDGTAYGLSAWMDRDTASPRPRFVAGPHEAQKEWESPRLGHGVKHRSPRLHAIGNALVPGQVFPFIKAIADRIAATA